MARNVNDKYHFKTWASKAYKGNIGPVASGERPSETTADVLKSLAPKAKDTPPRKAKVAPKSRGMNAKETQAARDFFKPVK